MTKREKWTPGKGRAVRAAMRLFRKMPRTFAQTARAYGPAHQALWKACAAISRGKK